MPTASAYGTTNPRGLEPWPIEQTLAPLAVGNSQAEAQMMLENYQQQRDAAANVYSGDLQQQHQYAYDQLAQQLQEANMKALPENAKAGTLGIMASSPAYQGVFGGADPGSIAAAIGQSTRLQNADIAQKGGAATWSLANAGMPATQADVQGITGLNVNPGTSIPVQVANIKLQGDLARANASSRAAGPRTSTDFTNPYGGKTTVSFPAGMSQAQRDAYLQNEGGLVPIDRPPPNAPLPNTTTAPNQPPNRTNLPVAKTDTPANNPPRAQNTAAGAAAARQQVLSQLDAIQNSHPQVYADIKAGMTKNNGVPNIVADPSKAGGFAVVGATGTHY
jgi:hypothetical protein